MEGWGSSSHTLIHPCYKVRWRGQARGDTFGTCSRERAQPQPRAPSGVEDSEVKLAMSLGLVTRVRVEGVSQVPWPPHSIPWGTATSWARP